MYTLYKNIVVILVKVLLNKSTKFIYSSKFIYFLLNKGASNPIHLCQRMILLIFLWVNWDMIFFIFSKFLFMSSGDSIYCPMNMDYGTGKSPTRPYQANTVLNQYNSLRFWPKTLVKR